eukprot:4877115-Prymnesium_polylepis.2
MVKRRDPVTAWIEVGMAAETEGVRCTGVERWPQVAHRPLPPAPPPSASHSAACSRKARSASSRSRGGAIGLGRPPAT